jgi:hypothetical protein
VRKPAFTPFLIASCLLAAGFSSLEAASPIEAVKGKEYTITKEHGPWMIMVASFSPVQNEAAQKDGGFTAREAAVELVYQLRDRAGIPAYVFIQDAQKGEIETSNRLQQREKRIYAARRNQICVLAGNYTSIDKGSKAGKSARRTLAYIKKHFKADFLLQHGGRFKPTPGQPTPLSGAFFTVNPLLSPEEVKDATVDPLLVKMNRGQKYSLFENPHQYTLVIATFTGGSSKLMLGDDEREKTSFLDAFTPGDAAYNAAKNSLDKAGDDAMELAEAMRNANKYGYGEDYDVFVWHDRRKSVVTIGGFDSFDDPRVKQYMERFAAKQKPVPKNPGRAVIVAEFFTIPKSEDFTQAKKHWLFDPVPRVMKVPRVNRRGMAN